MKVESARIVNANRAELVVIIYEALLDELRLAIDMSSKEEYSKVKKHVNNAKKIVKELKDTLNLNYGIAKDLLRLYDYIDLSLNSYIIKKDSIYLIESKKIIEKMHFAFEEISKNNTGKNVMKNCEQIYTGLTYGVNGLNEITIGNSKKGIMA